MSSHINTNKVLLRFPKANRSINKKYKNKKNIENTFFNSHFFLSLRHIGKAYKNKRHKLTKDKEQFSRME